VTERPSTPDQRIESGLLIDPALHAEALRRVPLVERMTSHQVPGVSVAVIDDGEIVWAKGYGVRENGRPDPITPKTRFQAASISKPTTALAVLRLVQEGRLDLDEDVNRYLRSWQVPANGDWQPRLTLRHLLSHTGGVTVHGFPGYLPDGRIPTLLQILEGEPPTNTQPIRVDTIPGLQFRYAGGGTTIVQQLLTDVVGQTFPQLMRELVLDPLGMTASTFSQPLPESLWAVAATGHREDVVALQGKWHVYPELAAAGLWTTPSDLARLALAVQRMVANTSGAFLRADLARELLTRQFRTKLGLGFFLEGSDASLRFSHGGGNEGFRCYLVAYAGRPQGAVVMTNGDGGWALNGEILQTIAAEYASLLDPSYDSLPRRRLTPMPVPVGTDILAGYVGDYALRPDVVIVVARKGTTLQVQPTGQASFDVDPISETTFLSRALNVEIAFHRNDRGLSTGLTLKQNDQELSARKKVT
jgi:CubicO group peptidase (beta-lactamase class C family)